jgi:hypothetical protein
MSQQVRSSAKWRHTFNALKLANEAIGGKPAKRFLIADSDDPVDVERSFSPDATPAHKAKAREFLDYCFVGEGFDLTVDRGDKYYDGPREKLSDGEKSRRREAITGTYKALGL